jgi:hypothetical protein
LGEVGGEDGCREAEIGYWRRDEGWAIGTWDLELGCLVAFGHGDLVLALYRARILGSEYLLGLECEWFLWK